MYYCLAANLKDRLVSGELPATAFVHAQCGR